MALVQKFIFDFTFGIYIASGALTLYAVFDYITFEKTIRIYFDDNLDKRELTIGGEDGEFKFALEKNAKSALVIFATGQLILLATYFTVQILQKMQAIKYKPVLNTSMILLIMAIILIAFSEDYQENKLQK